MSRIAKPSPAAHEIEQTLRVARDAIERDIARYRIWVFASVVTMIAAMNLGFGVGTWFPVYFFGGCLVYALGLWALVTRAGFSSWMPHVALFVDMLAVTANFWIDAKIGPLGATETDIIFTPYILGPALFLALIINALRYSRSSSILGAITAPVLFFATVVSICGFHRAQIPVVVILFLAGLISAAAATQARKNLDRFARLQLLRRYLQPAAVERVMREDPEAALALGGRLATVTLLAADLRGFTSMSEKLPPNEVVAQLNAYHGAMVAVIERHGGAIDKFIGDGTLVIFGLEAEPAAGAAAAVRCAAAMLEALSAHNEERARLGQAPLRMGIGIHTGPVIAGNIGVPGQRLEFTVIGDAVNTAARLEGLTKDRDASVLISSATAELLADRSVVREVDAVSIRGKERAQAVFVLSDAPKDPASHGG